MAQYSESAKKAYLTARKKGQTSQPFGKWLVEKVTQMKYGGTARDVYQMSDESKRNRGRMASSARERP